MDGEIDRDRELGIWKHIELDRLNRDPVIVCGLNEIWPAVQFFLVKFKVFSFKSNELFNCLCGWCPRDFIFKILFIYLFIYLLSIFY